MASWCSLGHRRRVTPTNGQVRRKPLGLKGFLSRPGGQERNFTPLTDRNISESIPSDGVRPPLRNPLLTRWVSLSSTLDKCRIPWGARDTASLVHLPGSDGDSLLGPRGGVAEGPSAPLTRPGGHTSPSPRSAPSDGITLQGQPHRASPNVSVQRPSPGRAASQTSAGRGRRNKVKSVFCPDMRRAKNSSQPSSVRPQGGRACRGLPLHF